MSEYESLVEGYSGLTPQICVCRHGIDTDDCGAFDCVNKPGPLTDEEHQALEEMAVPLITLEEIDASRPIISNQDEIAELRSLRGDQRPVVGQHYVIFGGKPCPVKRDSLTITEDEFVRSSLDLSDTLKDHDGQRQARAERTLRIRFRGYVSGEMNTL